MAGADKVDILRYIVKNHAQITPIQWNHIHGILQGQGSIFPEQAYVDDPNFASENDPDKLQLAQQASTALDYFDGLHGVIERQLNLNRPNWMRWMTAWLRQLATGSHTG